MAQKKTDDGLTPMMRQFYNFKHEHPDALLLFRCGDFYETYADDAVEDSWHNTHTSFQWQER